jgi:diguanylate cyclase (GGDEF)-like protein/PAS domain S-box-containing protein
MDLPRRPQMTADEAVFALLLAVLDFCEEVMARYAPDVPPLWLRVELERLARAVTPVLALRLAELEGEQAERLYARHQAIRDQRGVEPAACDRPGGGHGVDASGRDAAGRPVPVGERRLLLAHASPEALLDALLPARAAVYVKDREGRYLMVNAAGAAHLGYAPDQLVGRTDVDVFPGQLGERVWRSDQDIMAAGEARTVEEPVIVDGGLRTYLTSKAPLRDPAGEVVGIVGVSNDVTSLAEVDAEVRRREAQLAEAQALTRVGSWEHDLCTGEQTWSEETYRILGHDASQFEPTFDAFLACVHPEDRQRLTAAVDAALAPGADGAYALQHRIIRPDGEERICRCRGRVFFELDGTPLRMVSAVHDVTDQRPDAARLGRILNSAHEAFVSMNAAGSITEWNQAAEETFGWSRSEVIGHELASLIIPPASREVHRLGVRRFLATGASSMLDRRLEFNALHRDGHEFPAELTVAALAIESSWEFHGFIRDISDRRRHQDEHDVLIAKLDGLARTDELTGLHNRRAWGEELARELARAARTDGHHLCVAMLDLDAFKAYNDAHGHQAGDDLLRSLASTWRTKVRPTDVLARYGGEEFAIALPAWPLDGALRVVERLRDATPAGQTCSAGLVAWDGHESADEVVGRADRALYEAKRAGRNQTVTDPPGSADPT